jgi:alpha-2-macroglobulin
MFINKSILSTIVMPILLLFTFAVLAMVMSTPSGSLVGRIALEQPGFGLSTFDIRQNKVYVAATGPRPGNREERGVWVKPDGTFLLSGLPVGEYSLKIHATGFETQYQHGIYIDEARTTHLYNPIAMHALSPEIHLASNSRVFTSGEKPYFWLNATGGQSVIVKIYATDIKPYLKPSPNAPFEFSGDFTLSRSSHQTPDAIFTHQAPVQVLKRKLEENEGDSSRADFKLDKPLPKGNYIATATMSGITSQRAYDVMWFNVSDLGLVIKYAPEKELVRAVDLKTLQPRSGVQINLMDSDNHQMVATQPTRSDGFAEFPLPKSYMSKSSYHLLAYGQQGQDEAYSNIPFWSFSSSPYKTYFYTERPVYRLGQTVYYKGITRVKGENGLENPKNNLPIAMTIEDPDNNTVFQGNFSTNAFGSFHGTFDIPAGGKTGAYQVLLAYPDKTQSTEAFEVAEYRKPEYQVDVTPIQQRVAAGDSTKARVRATYYFGGPVANARIKYSIYASPDWRTRFKLMARPDYYDYFDDWDASTSDDSDSSGDYISEGYATTDANGEAVIEVKTRTIAPLQGVPNESDYQDKRYKIEAEVTDLSRKSVIGNGYFSVTPGDFALLVNPENAVYQVNDTTKTELQATDYQGHAVANQPLHVALTRLIFNSDKGSYISAVTEQEANVTTDTQGKAHVQFKLGAAMPTDTYFITARSEDNSGHTVYDQSGIWVVNESAPYIKQANEAKQQPLTLKLDKPVYRLGDTAKLMITAPVTGKEGIQAIVSVEGERLYNYQIVPLKATGTLVKIPITEPYTPNVYFTVAFVASGRQFYNESQIVKVSPQHHFLNIAVQSDKQKYKPGESVTYRIKATRANGKPAAHTELSLGVVDESIYAIRPEAAPDIRKFFYKKRDNLVSTINSFPEEYSGGPDKMEPQVRKDFRDMAAWVPELVTDSQGIATTTIKLPDNLTTWRATVRGVSMQTDVGWTTQKIVCTKDLLLRLALPRFFTQGDEGFLTAVVDNDTPKSQRVYLTLETSPQFKSNTPFTQTLTVAAGKADRFSWPVKIAGIGEGLVRVKGIGQTDSDALELKLPIRPLGVETFAIQSNRIDANTGSIDLPFHIPGNVLSATVHYILSLSSSTIGSIVSNYSSLIDYPYGCVEQTMDKMMPSVIAVQLHQRLGVPLATEAQTRFNAVYTQSLAKLYDIQNDDGGWGWWKFDDSNPYLTAYVLEGFSLLGAADYPVDPTRLAKGRKWLQDNTEKFITQLKDPKRMKDPFGEADHWIDLAYMTYVQTLYDPKIPKPEQQWLLEQSHQMVPEALSYVTLAFKNSDNLPAAQKTYHRLIALSTQTATTTDWDHSSAMKKRLHDTKWFDYTFRFTGVESTALALRTVVAMEPNNVQRQEAIKTWLMLQRNKDGWDNTKTTAQVFRALLAEELAYHKQQPTVNFTVLTNLAQTLIPPLTFDNTNRYDPDKQYTLGGSDIAPQGVHISKNGPGRLYYNSLLTYFLPLSPGQSVPEAASMDGLQVERAFFRLTPGPVMSDGTIHFTASPVDDGNIRAGETLLMKVHIQSPIAIPYTMVDVSLPSGGEVVMDDPKLSAVGNAAPNDFSGDWGPAWWTHQDVLDDRIVFFATHLPAGASDVYTMVRMEMPGRFQMNPVQLQGMYSNRVRAYSKLDSLNVVDQ